MTLDPHNRESSRRYIPIIVILCLAGLVLLAYLTPQLSFFACVSDNRLLLHSSNSGRPQTNNSTNSTVIIANNSDIYTLKDNGQHIKLVSFNQTKSTMSRDKIQQSNGNITDGSSRVTKNTTSSHKINTTKENIAAKLNDLLKEFSLDAFVETSLKPGDLNPEKLMHIWDQVRPKHIRLF